jgi:hypothetical protein
MERIKLLNIGATSFLLRATPMVGQLLEHTQNSNKQTPRAKAPVARPKNMVEVAWSQQTARNTVYREYAVILANRAHGHLPTNKPDDML